MAHMRWGQIEPLLDKGNEYFDGKFTNNDIRDMVLSGELQMWVVLYPDSDRVKSIISTMFVDYPARKVCCIFFAAGENPQDLARHEKYISKWAKEHGCKSMEALGRRGWIRYLTDYKHGRVVMIKEL